jgi:Tfp pilus assembly protein PilO
MEIELKNKFLLNNNEEISNKINSIANSSSMNVEDFHVLDNLQTEKNKRFFLRLNGNYANFVLFLKHFSQVYKILKIDRISRVSQEVEINFRSIL